MNNKQLKHLIKSKANEVEIKNLSAQIIEKAKQLPLEPSVIEKRPFVFRFKPAFAVSLAVMVTIALALFYTPTVNQDPFELNAYDQALMTSSMSIVYAYEVGNDENLALSLNASVFEAPYMIDDEIENLSRYLSWMESFFASDQAFNHTILDVTETQYLRHIKFETQTFSGELVSYELIIFDNFEDSKTEKLFHGQIIIDEDIYPITLIFDKTNKDVFDLFTEFENEYHAHVRFTRSEVDNMFAIHLNKNSSAVTSLELKKTLGSNAINLNFVLGKVNGSYSFEQGEDHHMIANYAIIRNSQMERGSIGIQIASRDNLPHVYELTIKPFGELPYQAQRAREALPPRPRPKAGPFATLI